MAVTPKICSSRPGNMPALIRHNKANANAQTNHKVDTVRYDYFDLKGRSVRSSFFAETNMGWRMWMLADDGVIRKKVWIDTIKE